MSISIEKIKELRDSTGVSMTVCKKALEEANGDFDAAVDVLRKQGLSKAASKADRSASEGAIALKIDGNKGAIVQLNCETDFMARGDEFLTLLNKVVSALFNGEIDPSNKEIEFVQEEVLKLGENIQVGGMAVLEGDHLGGYIHSNKKIGVLISLGGGNDDLAKDIAMHAAATNPSVLSPDEVDEKLVMKEKEIWADQLANEGKPADIIEKVMMGKEKKFREENALLKQAFVKNPDQTIEQLVASSGATVKSFVRFSI